MESEPAVSEKFSKYWSAVKDNPSDFASWTCLLQTVDQENILEEGREAYEGFFKYYPYCYGYWKKYADLEKKNGNDELARKVFKDGVEAIPLSVDLWIHYLNFTPTTINEEPDSNNLIKNLYEDAIEAAGLEFRSDKLYDAYIDWEKSQGNLKNVTLIYDRVLSVPTQQYIKQFTKFKEHVNSSKPSDILTSDEYLKLLGEIESIPPGVTANDDADPIVLPSTAPPGVDDALSGDTIAAVEGPDTTNENIQDENDYTMDDKDEEMIIEKQANEEAEAIRAKIIASRELVFRKNEVEVKKRWRFEDAIKRPYFHVKPLERLQLKNWREYLDFEIKEGSHQMICILFERCLIACALYEEFWQKFISYLQSRTDDVDRMSAVRNVFERGCTIHLRKKANIILNWAAFEEEQNNTEKSRSILQSLDETVPGVVMVKLRRAGLERRNGSPAKAIEILQEEIEKTVSIDEKSFFAIKCSKLLTKVLDDGASAKEIIYKALENDKGNKQLYLHLLDLETNCSILNEKNLQDLCNLVYNCQELSSDFKQGIFQRRLEILEDFGSSIGSIAEAYDAYQQQYKIKPGVVMPKKRGIEDSDPDSAAKAAKTAAPPLPNSAPPIAPQYSNSAYTGASYAGATYTGASYTGAPYTGASYTGTSYAGASNVAAAATNTYGYSPAGSNQWGAYAAQNTGGYYGWYNPYGSYPQQPTQ